MNTPAEMRAQRRAQARHRWRYSQRRERLEALAEALLSDALGDVFGRWCLQIGACQRNLGERAGTLRRVACAPWSRNEGDLVADECMLPLASDSCDAVVLAFALEFSTRPHRLVREAERVLNDRGVLIVLGQSPLGLAAWPRLLGLSGRALPRGTGLVRPGRLSDWLDLLDFEVEQKLGFAAGWPWRGRARWMPAAPLADCYALIARKRVAPITPLRVPLRRPRAAAAPGGVVAGNFRKRWERESS
jgi:SAM-dependent methyltransferase